MIAVVTQEVINTISTFLLAHIFALPCFAQSAFQVGSRRLFNVHAASLTFGGGGGGGRVSLSYSSRAC